MSGTLTPVDIDFIVRIDEMDRKINLGGTAEDAFVPVNITGMRAFLLRSKQIRKE